MGSIAITITTGFEFTHSINPQPEALAFSVVTVKEQGMIPGGIGINLYPAGDGTRCVAHREARVANQDIIIRAIKLVGSIGITPLSGGQIGPAYGAVVFITTDVIGVTIEGEVGHKA